jgi:hypothetical protein
MLLGTACTSQVSLYVVYFAVNDKPGVNVGEIVGRNVITYVGAKEGTTVGL